MIERGEDFGFSLESGQPIGIAGHRGGQHLDRHRPFQIAVGRAIHLTHAADTDLRSDLVDADSSAGNEAQAVGSIAFMVAWTRSLLGDGLVASDFIDLTFAEPPPPPIANATLLVTQRRSRVLVRCLAPERPA